MSIEEKFNQAKGSVEAVEGAVSGVKNIFKKDGE